MNKIYNRGFSLFLFLLIGGFFCFPFLSSCGKAGNSNAVSFNIQYQVINLSPDLGPVSLYIDFKNNRNAAYYYAIPSGYFYLTSIDTPFQIRRSPNSIPGTVVSTENLFSLNNALKANLKYTLFIAGFNRDSSLSSVFLTDTSALPKIGYGKVRFLNVSPFSPNFDVVANGVSAFTNQQYLKVSPYIEMPAGNYNFQIFATGTSTPIIGTIQNVTVQDGKLYTMYTYGLAGRTDSLAFGKGVIVNR